MGVVDAGDIPLHVKAVAGSADGVQDRCVKCIDGTLAIELRELSGLDASAAVAQQDEWPIVSAGVLLVRIVTGVDNEGVVHHRSAIFGYRLEFLH